MQDPAKAGNNALVEMLTTGVRRRRSRSSACHMDQKWLPQVKFLGSCTIPKIDVQLGASFHEHSRHRVSRRSTRRPTATYRVRWRRAASAVCRPAVRRSGTTGRQPAPAGLDRMARGSTQIDMRLGKVVRFSNRKAVVSLDLFNILNDDDDHQ